MSHEFYESNDVKKTRKPHPCHLCYQDIPKGSECLYEKGKWDGDFFSRYSHNECSSKWIELNKGENSEEWIMLDELEECRDQTMNFNQWKEHIGEIYADKSI